MSSETSPPLVTLTSLIVFAHDPVGLATFWSEAVGTSGERPRQAGAFGGVEVAPTDTSFAIEFAPTEIHKTGQNRIHFDLTTASDADMADTIDAVVADGARPIDIGQRPDEGHVVLVDPEGNEFCVLQPDNRFLAGCPRLGAVNCDGTVELGYFWSAALGWPLVWDRDDETAIQAPDHTGPKLTWSGRPLMPRHGPERFHFRVRPTGTDLASTIDALVSLGAVRADGGDDCAGAVAMIDPDGNPFCVDPPRDVTG